MPGRVSESFGPFLAERTQPNGRGQLSLTLAFRATSFGAVNGVALNDGSKLE